MTSGNSEGQRVIWKLSKATEFSLMITKRVHKNHEKETTVLKT